MKNGVVIPTNGNQLKKMNPEVFDKAVELLAAGMTRNQVADAVGTSPQTISGIRKHHAELVETARERQARSFSELAMLSSEEAEERLLNNPDKISFKDLMIGAAIATDKALLLTGQATQRIEHVVKQDDDEFDQLLKKAKQADVIQVHGNPTHIDLNPTNILACEGIDTNIGGIPVPQIDENALSSTNDTDNSLSNKQGTK
jgi:transcriptional regulator